MKVQIAVFLALAALAPGAAVAAKMSPEARSEAARKAVRARWAKAKKAKP